MDIICEKTGKFLLEISRQALSQFIQDRTTITTPQEYPEELNEKMGIFVTIYNISTKERQLRGCVGLPYPDRSLVEGIIQATVLACQDTRFVPLSNKEIPDLSIDISILSKPQIINVESPEEYPSKITPYQDGLILKLGMHSGLFLPVVWDHYADPQDFLAALSLKAGLPSETWYKEKGINIYKFITQVFNEHKKSTAEL